MLHDHVSEFDEVILVSSRVILATQHEHLSLMRQSHERGKGFFQDWENSLELIVLVIPREMESNRKPLSFGWTHRDVVALYHSELSDLDQVLKRVSYFEKSVDGIDVVIILYEILRLDFIPSCRWLLVRQEMNDLVFPSAAATGDTRVWILAWNRVDLCCGNMGGTKECLLAWGSTVPVCSILHTTMLSLTYPNRLKISILPSREKTQVIDFRIHHYFVQIVKQSIERKIFVNFFVDEEFRLKSDCN